MPFTLSGPDKDNLVWLMSGEGLREEMRERIARALYDQQGHNEEDDWDQACLRRRSLELSTYTNNQEGCFDLADRILSLPGISTSYGINLGEKADVAELFSQWLGSIDYLEDQ